MKEYSIRYSAVAKQLGHFEKCNFNIISNTQDVFDSLTYLNEISDASQHKEKLSELGHLQTLAI